MPLQPVQPLQGAVTPSDLTRLSSCTAVRMFRAGSEHLLRAVITPAWLSPTWGSCFDAPGQPGLFSALFMHLRGDVSMAASMEAPSDSPGLTW